MVFFFRGNKHISHALGPTGAASNWVIPIEIGGLVIPMGPLGPPSNDVLPLEIGEFISPAGPDEAPINGGVPMQTS